MFIIRRLMSEKSMSFIPLFFTFVATLLGLPNIALHYGVGSWSTAHTGGVIDARFIALVDTVLEALHCADIAVSVGRKLIPL